MEKNTPQNSGSPSASESGGLLLICPKCGRPFKNKGALAWHVQRLHPEIQGKTEKPGKKPEPEVKISPEDIAKIVREEVAKYLGGSFGTVPTTPKHTGEEPEAEERLEGGRISVSEIEVPEKPIIRVPINVEPEVIMFYRWWNGKAKPEDRMSFSEWINEVVREHFVECLKVESAIIVKRR